MSKTARRTPSIYKEADLHNATTLAAFHSDAIKVEAMDFLRDADTGELVPCGGFKAKKRDLPDAIHVAQGVRVMVLRNLDVEDGIVNGAFATIRHWTTAQVHGQTLIQLIGVEFDSPNAGLKSLKKHAGVPRALVYLERLTESASCRGLI